MSKRIWASLFFALMAVLAMAQTSTIKEIVVRGNQRVSREAILAAMRTKVGQPYVQQTLDEDEEAIERLGFFENADVRVTPLEGGEFQVTVDVAEYPEIKEIRVTGNLGVSDEDILKVLTLKPGDIYNLNQVRPSSDAVEALYTKKGFFARVNALEPVSESPGTVNLEVVEAKVGSVSVQGNRTTKDWVMRRLIRTRPGDPFSGPKWQSDLSRIANTGWFESVQSLRDEEQEPGRINLIADVREARTNTFNAGLQVDPRSSIAGVLNVQVNNWRGTGQGIGINLLQAARGGGPSVDLSYTNPFFDARDTHFRASIFSRLVYRFAGTLGGGGNFLVNDDDRYTERRTGLSAGLSRVVRDVPSLTLQNTISVGVSGRFENVSTSDINIGGTGGFLGGSDLPGYEARDFIQQNGNVGVLTLGTIRNRRDVNIDPSRGDYLSLQVEPGYANITRTQGVDVDENVLGAHGFFRSFIEYRTYFTDQPPRGEDVQAPRRVLALRARYGTIFGQVPFFEQFFAGGSDTVRGYPEDRFWGKSTMLLTAELRYPIQRAFNIIGFIDYGGAWGGYPLRLNEYTQSRSADFHLGFGVGLSFRTPLGPIRLDLGFNEQGKSRTHFLIGTSF